ncbi:Uncharacterised protein [Clostridioides difficile]|nr:Uncharacterised protein [Clostridioides difficile]VHX17123.1 Uncharacterised protein [Clostridioides difficile]
MAYGKIYSTSFILTKWYVNERVGNPSSLKLIRFILTKWYVNSIINPTFIVISASCFILTKWYVNFLKNVFDGLTDDEFYIN